MKVERFENFVDGKRMQSESGCWLTSANPFTGEVWAEVPQCTADDVDLAITPTERGKLLCWFADLIARDAEKLAVIEVKDNGKLLAEMIGQLRYMPEWFRYFGGLADKIEGSVLSIDKPEMFAYTKREPLGVVVAITPWNSHYCC